MISYRVIVNHEILLYKIDFSVTCSVCPNHLSLNYIHYAANNKYYSTIVAFIKFWLFKSSSVRWSSLFFICFFTLSMICFISFFILSMTCFVSFFIRSMTRFTSIFSAYSHQRNLWISFLFGSNASPSPLIILPFPLLIIS